MLDAGLERKVVQKSGSYFSFEDERLGQGRQNATAFLREHPDVTQQILPRLQAQLGPTRSSRRGCCRSPSRRRPGGRSETKAAAAAVAGGRRRQAEEPAEASARRGRLRGRRSARRAARSGARSTVATRALARREHSATRACGAKLDARGRAPDGAGELRSTSSSAPGYVDDARFARERAPRCWPSAARATHAIRVDLERAGRRPRDGRGGAWPRSSPSASARGAARRAAGGGARDGPLAGAARASTRTRRAARPSLRTTPDGVG